jgi:hypothetical protein
MSIGCVVTRKAIRTQWQSVDYFCSDVVGKKVDGSHVYIQVTAGQAEAVRQRRRKLEDIPWHNTDTVLLLQLVQTPDPANGKKTLWFFRVHGYKIYLSRVNRVWQTDDQAVPVPKEWFHKKAV